MVGLEGELERALRGALVGELEGTLERTPTPTSGRRGTSLGAHRAIWAGVVGATDVTTDATIDGRRYFARPARISKVKWCYFNGPTIYRSCFELFFVRPDEAHGQQVNIGASHLFVCLLDSNNNDNDEPQ